jgi:hypothetical protein
VLAESAQAELDQFQGRRWFRAAHLVLVLVYLAVLGLVYRLVIAEVLQAVVAPVEERVRDRVRRFATWANECIRGGAPR